MFSSLTWQVWKRRNEFIFSGTSLLGSNLLHLCLHWGSLYKDPCGTHAGVVPLVHHEIIWNAPLLDGLPSTKTVLSPTPPPLAQQVAFFVTLLEIGSEVTLNLLKLLQLFTLSYGVYLKVSSLHGLKDEVCKRQMKSVNSSDVFMVSSVNAR
ncbi:hypothetical protein F3Y22_tig00111723pilonHSYRG00081 [Hibiscus syriacus]|uniref:Uncharacterized protein n=1 Tax=Hibiscus syriacus TaxID=106335 RepID=A0A6A2Y2J4_HIBSY|nr:hypothetical protein F3Y22_tig00111723pilonHSYRG00081 [Hibiscus syriacus]